MSTAPTVGAAEVRRAMFVGAGGIATYFLVAWLIQPTFGFRMGPVALLFGTLIVSNVGLGFTAPGWCGNRWAGTLYGCLHEVVLTAILHYMGGLRMGILVGSYAFPVFHAAMLGSDAAAFITANVAALCYGVLAYVERGGWLISNGAILGGIEPGQEKVFVLMAWCLLNFLALYATRYGHGLRHQARELQEKVAERTAALTALNTKLQEKARALEDKQEEVKSFVYTVTHDLKNPLSSILLTADLLREREGDRLTDPGREDLERIVSLAGNTEDMIRDLLGLFRITSEPETPGWVDLSGLTHHALDTLRPQIGAKGVQVTVGTLPKVWGQPRKLSNVVTNLLSNATKYVARGRGCVEVSGAVENGHVLYAVRDNGIGIPSAYHRGIFELFGRVPAPEQEVDGCAVGGTGVGLAIVKRIVEAHGGNVTVESEVGVGSAFTVRLPAARQG
jgi:signal transduction histidine kinase